MHSMHSCVNETTTLKTEQLEMYGVRQRSSVKRFVREKVKLNSGQPKHALLPWPHLKPLHAQGGWKHPSVTPTRLISTVTMAHIIMAERFTSLNLKWSYRGISNEGTIAERHLGHSVVHNKRNLNLKFSRAFCKKVTCETLEPATLHNDVICAMK